MEDAARLTEEQGRALVVLARQTLNRKFGLDTGGDRAESPQSPLDAPALRAPGGIFVTLKSGGRLRGCIGTLVGHEPLAQGVCTYAEHAAFHDPRFAPLKAKELNRITIEVSVLTPSQPLAYTDTDDLIAKLRPGVDGVTLRKGDAGATFLPQVWEQLPRPEDFLSQLCLKAGLPADDWRTERLHVETYQVQYFEEPH